MLSVFCRSSRSSEAVCSQRRCVASNSCRMSSSRLLAMRFASTARKSSCFKASTSVLSLGTSATSLLTASGSGSGFDAALSFSSAVFATVSRETRSISVSRCTLLSSSASRPARSSWSSDFSSRACASCAFNSSMVATYSSSLAVLLSFFAGGGASSPLLPPPPPPPLPPLEDEPPSSSTPSPSKSWRLPISLLSTPLRAPLAAALPSTLTLSSSSILVSLLPEFQVDIFRMPAPRRPLGFPPPPAAPPCPGLRRFSWSNCC
mmetsp:Transcript_70933/g.198951  ORF Transcript_70933/g.198951 Transcript_70933/m.198951 type:complete len:262 (+) Transcript_70933:422-1207(+)